MKIVRHAGGDRVIDLVRPWLTDGSLLDLVTPSFSLFAFAELAHELSRLANARVVLPGGDDDLGLVGADADRGARNRLQTPWLARRCADWLSATVEVRRAAGRVPQGTIVLRDSGSQPQQVLLGSLALSTDGLGLTPGNTLNLIQASEGEAESALLSAWFDAQWQSLAASLDFHTSETDNAGLGNVARSRPPRGLSAHTISTRSERPCHHGIGVVPPMKPASISRGLCARRGN